MFGKAMSIPDVLMESYFELLTEIPLEEIARLKKGIVDGSLHPRAVKVTLAKELVKMYHGAEAAEKEALEFDRVFSDKQLPSDIPEVCISKEELSEGKIWIVKLITLAGLASGRNEAGRLVDQGAVSLDEIKVDSSKDAVLVKDGSILKVGKRKFAKIKFK